MKSVSLTSTIVTLCLSSSVALAGIFGGGIGSGGGFAVRTSQGLQLLDLALYAPKTAANCGGSGFQMGQVKGIRYTALPVVSKIEETLHFWARSRPAFVEKLRAAMAKLTFSFQQSPLKKIDETYSAPDNWASQVFNVARYKSNHVDIFIPIFNQLCQVSQVGLIFHEVLRQVQIDYEAGLSTDELQKLTAAVTSQRDPRQLLSADKLGSVQWETSCGIFTGTKNCGWSKAEQERAYAAQQRDEDIPASQIALAIVSRFQSCGAEAFRDLRIYSPSEITAAKQISFYSQNIDKSVQLLDRCYRAFGYPPLNVARVTRSIELRTRHDRISVRDVFSILMEIDRKK